MSSGHFLMSIREEGAKIQTSTHHETAGASDGGVTVFEEVDSPLGGVTMQREWRSLDIFYCTI